MKKLFAFIPLVASIVACAPSGSQFFATLKKDSNTNKTYVGEFIESGEGTGQYYNFINVGFMSGDLDAVLNLVPSDFTAKKGDTTLTGELFIISYRSVTTNGALKWYIVESATSSTISAPNGSFPGPQSIAFSTDLDNTYDIYYKTTKLVAGEDIVVNG